MSYVLCHLPVFNQFNPLLPLLTTPKFPFLVDSAAALLYLQWYINTFPDYEFVFMHQPSASVGQIAWLVPTMGPPLLLAVALAIIGENFKFLCINIYLCTRLFLFVPLREVSRYLKRTS